MAKRRTVSDESDVEETPSTSKRQRRQAADDAYDEEEEAAPSARNTKKNGKGKDKRAKAQDGDEDYDMNAQDAEEEQQFEEQHGEAIRRQVESRSKASGSIADHGIIEYIEMHQFMCHKYLCFTFGPRINFIIGHNGSGKSAVLTALTIALGGKAATTGRGNGLKAFIREGQGASEVTIHIKNRGEDAYKPKDYGSTIIITRRFTREGASTWKIQNSEKKLVSSRREDLQAICDHMNIQVDNPMNVLTQDSARQFLSASSPSDKYKLFLRGTQLQQLSEEYETSRQNITTTAKMLEKKKEALPDLRTAMQEAQSRYEEAKLAREQRTKVNTLKQEIAWAHVKSKEEDLERAFAEVAKVERNIPKLIERRDAAQAKFEALGDQLVLLEQESVDYGSSDDLKARKKEIIDELKALDFKSRALDRDITQMNKDMKGQRESIVTFDAQIEQETRKLEAQAAGRQEQLRQQLEDASNALKAAEEAARALNVQIGEQDEVIRSVANRGKAAENAVDGIKRELSNIQATIDGAKRAAGNKYAVYGPGMGQAVNAIRGARWHGETPVGPLGEFVKLRDRTWGDLVRNIIGSRMFSFAVTDARDRNQLKQILDKYQCRGSHIIVSARDDFDFSSGEPAAHMTTVLRVLEITDPFVLRILVNTASIERTLLFNTRREASDVLGQQRGGGVGFSKDGFSVRNFGDGGEQSTPLNPRMDPKLAMLFREGDGAQQQKDFQEDIRRLEHELKEKQEEVAQFRKAHGDGNKHRKELSEQERLAKKRAGQLHGQRAQAQRMLNDEAPLEIAQFQEAKDEALREIESLKEQFTSAETQKAELRAIIEPLIEEQKTIEKRLDDFQSGKNAILHRTQEAAAARAQEKTTLEHWNGKLATEEAKLKKAQEDAAVTEVEFQEWTNKATEYCERVENPRKVALVQRLLDAAQNALKSSEKKHGASVEEMQEQVVKARRAFDAADKELRAMASLNKALRQAIHTRFEKWHEFRRHIALRTKHIFQYHLSNRGYYGKVLFNHEQGTLQLRVQTDDQAGTQAKEKDPRSLSGGEKSFSTICLLLALWEAIGCPIRCLDEFDVYMDAVNRRISMKMMIDTARASDKKQYVLITPQDMSNVNIDPSLIKVHRMRDPERGQGTLNFTQG